MCNEAGSFPCVVGSGEPWKVRERGRDSLLAEICLGMAVCPWMGQVSRGALAVEGRGGPQGAGRPEDREGQDRGDERVFWACWRGALSRQLQHAGACVHVCARVCFSARRHSAYGDGHSPWSPFRTWGSGQT